MFDFRGYQGTVELKYRAKYAQTPANINKLEVFFIFYDPWSNASSDSL